jgi:hypothetical protein
MGKRKRVSITSANAKQGESPCKELKGAAKRPHTQAPSLQGNSQVTEPAHPDTAMPEISSAENWQNRSQGCQSSYSSTSRLPKYQ